MGFVGKVGNVKVRSTKKHTKMSVGKPTKTCRMCERMWVGKAMERNFYRAGVGNYKPDCIYCYKTVQTTRNELNALNPGLRAMNVPRRIREHYGVGMLRVCQAAGITSGDLGRLIAADMERHGN